MEVSEKVEITNEGKRQQMFKDAAAQGDDVLNKLRDQGGSSSSGIFAALS